MERDVAFALADAIWTIGGGLKAIAVAMVVSAILRAVWNK